MLRIMIFKKFKLKFFILSAVLLTISSGLLFYRQLFIDEIKNEMGSKADLEELRSLDQQINSSMLSMRLNLNEGSDEILQTKNRINDLLNIILDIRKRNSELKTSLNEMKNYIADKNKNIDKFLMDVRELQVSLKSLNPTYNELQKSNIKFTLDGKDFYRECISDSLMYLITPSKDVEWKFNEDIKILGQILSYTKTPNGLIEKYYNAMGNIREKSKDIDSLLQQNKEKNISPQMTIVMKYDTDNKELGHSRGQTFLFLIFGSIVLYIVSIIFVVRNL